MARSSAGIACGTRVRHQCRVQRQGAAPLRYESAALLGLTVYLTYQSRGFPVRATITGPAAPHYEAGREQYVTRQVEAPGVRR